MATAIPHNLAPFSLEQVLSSTRGRVVNQRALSSRGSFPLLKGVATDSRQNLQGKIFVALRGEVFDGHAFLEQAAAAGASMLVVDARSLEAGEYGAQFLLKARELEQPMPLVVAVNDSLVALGDLALEHRRAWRGTLIAVAGSAGKTTTRSAIQALFSRLYPNQVHGTRGNLNNRIGVPMTLFGLEASHRWAIVELGTNCPGEVAELSRISEPQAGVLTLIDLEHTEGLGDLDGVELEEGALFKALPEDGLAVGFLEDERVCRQLLLCKASKRGYLEDDTSIQAVVTAQLKEALRSQLKIEKRALETPVLSCLQLGLNQQPLFDVQTHLLGKPGALAICAALSVALHYCPELLAADTVQEALKNVGEPGRSVPLPLAGNRWVIDDTYNSNPASVALSIDSGSKVARHTGGQLWLVLGEMRELGNCSEREHLRMGELSAQSDAVKLYAVGGDAIYAQQSARKSGFDAEFFEDAASVASALIPQLQPNDVILVKASRGVRAERVVIDLMNELPSREKL